MIKEVLGVGSRVEHSQYGEGIIAGARLHKYKIAFHLLQV